MAALRETNHVLSERLEAVSKRGLLFSTVPSSSDHSSSSQLSLLNELELSSDEGKMTFPYKR